ncbi:methyltransferase, TIGR04325 family [Eisenibacter elegans]|jgi:putative methyltransferase (TIGR04325 family)|uniref:methyltransferase, TIGR04325 family n=1 Tax=Eisenibacter elegans TaxID=997 RepID=UPI00040F301D|nr:methyltransferase, TIGR04325 family [Eisenibacter elegans]
MTKLAPIVLFIYNRPETLRRTLASLQRNPLAKDSVLYVFADGAKPGASPLDLAAIDEARQLVTAAPWCGEVKLLTRADNLGLAQAIYQGVTEVIEQYGRAIVLEDDLELSPFFLDYMNEALDCYAVEPRVWSIGACNFFSTQDHTPDTFFIPIPDCWGWATWANRWQYFEPDATKLLAQLQEQQRLLDFDLHGVYNFTQMLRAQVKTGGSSWAIRWQAQAYLHRALSLYPKYALVNHLASSKATHANNLDLSDYVTFPTAPIPVYRQPVEALPEVLQDMYQRYQLIFNQSFVYQGDSDAKTKKTMLKTLLKDLIPPLALKLYHRLRGTAAKEQALVQQKRAATVYWQGSYPSWQAAQAAAEGYDAPHILQKVREATLKVKRGEAAYERDSVVFDTPAYNWPLLANLLHIAHIQGQALEVLDFGGALGSAYFQHRRFFEPLKTLRWSVVEQAHFVACGRSDIADEHLQFYDTMEAACQAHSPTVLFASGVMQCLPEPYAWLKECMALELPYIILDRTAFMIDGAARLTVQYVPAHIYQASYPAWFLDYAQVCALLSSRYSLLTTFDNGITPPFVFEDGTRGHWLGMIWKKQ